MLRWGNIDMKKDFIDNLELDDENDEESENENEENEDE